MPSMPRLKRTLLPQPAPPSVDADSVLAQVRALQQKTLEILAEADRTKDLHTATLAIGQARGNLELLGRLAGELRDSPQVNIFMLGWQVVQARIVAALERHPKARDEVLRVLETFGDDPAH